APSRGDSSALATNRTRTSRSRVRRSQARSRHADVPPRHELAFGDLSLADWSPAGARCADGLPRVCPRARATRARGGRSLRLRGEFPARRDARRLPHRVSGSADDLRPVEPFSNLVRYMAHGPGFCAPCDRDNVTSAGDNGLRILVSNDDGVLAPGIALLAEVCASVGQVTVVAPD